MAVEQLMERPANELTYYYLNDNIEKTFTVKPNQVEKTEGKISKTIETIKNSDFKPKPSKRICTNCDYKDICTYRML